ncbi:MAG: arsenic resistance protein, partial [Chloroflexi bacterium]
VIAVGFIVQVQAGVWTMRLTERIFGSAVQPLAQPTD